MHPERGFITGVEALASVTVEDTTALAPAAPAAERPGVQLAR